METLTPTKPRCKGCGLPSWESLVSGARFGVVGDICRKCYRREEAARLDRARIVKLQTTETPYRFREIRGPKPCKLYLEVLNPEFGIADLTPRAVSRLILANPVMQRVFFGGRADA
jgi:hypothetical protein